MQLSTRNEVSYGKPEGNRPVLHDENESLNPLTFRLNDEFSVRLYPDTRPHCLETATLQKGLVLMRRGEELVEEGMGFGAPVAIYRDEPYFSSTAKCSFLEDGDDKALVKSFVMDTVSRKRIGEAAYFNGGMYTVLHRVFHPIYVLNMPLTPVFNKLLESATAFGVNTEFVKVKPRGAVNVKYTLHSDAITLEASFNQLEKKGCEQIVLLNEQGAAFFRRYSDSNGQTLRDGEIGAWNLVGADQAELSNSEGTLSFSLKNTRKATLFRGREKIRDRYSWVGLSYSLPSTSRFFKYKVLLKTGSLS